MKASYTGGMLLTVYVGVLGHPAMAQECEERGGYPGSVVGVVIESCAHEDMVRRWKNQLAADPQLEEKFRYASRHIVKLCSDGHEGDSPEENHEKFHTSALFGPYFVLIEEGTNKVRPFYPPGGHHTDPSAWYASTQYAGLRVKVTGCVSDGNWPSIEADTVELLE